MFQLKLGMEGLTSVCKRLSPTCAPVSVAMSRIISADRSLLAYTTPSASTSLPSASVLLISTVLQNKKNTDLACKIISVCVKSYHDGTDKSNQIILHIIIIKESLTFQSTECGCHQVVWLWVRPHSLRGKTLRGGYP